MRGIILVASSAPFAGRAAVQTVADELNEDGFGAVLFEDLLLHGQNNADPLTVFDTELLAARLAVVSDLLQRDPRFRGCHFGLLALGGAGAAAIIHATERPGFVEALVLHDAPLVAASRCLPFLSVPSVLLLPLDKGEDNAFLASRPAAAVREIHLLGDVAHPTLVQAISAEGRRWFSRHVAAVE